ncbi:AMP-binding protein [Pseudomaricurvus hydrocarbonicus]|uniref:AMP-binding protein n=1 Tax=Pseudomaricurvus hydrocarbonicus TaxID=1470433 RepID=UPI001AA05D15
MTVPVVDAIATHAKAQPGALACMDLDSDRRWSYSEFDAAINQVVHWLIERLGQQSGARIATVARNKAEILLLNFACERAGAIFVPLNWRLSIAELDQLIVDAEPAFIFHDDEFKLPQCSAHVCQLSELTELSQHYPVEPAVSARRECDQPVLLLYTSGTSGNPKGVMISESNIFWSHINFNLGNGVSSQSVFLCDMPLFHTAGLITNARAPLLAGGSVLVSSGFDATQTLLRLADKQLAVTHYFSVPQMAQMLWNNPDFTPEKLQGLQVYATGGAPNPGAQIERFVRAGIPMSDGFGMTETCSNFGMPVGDGDRLIAKAGSCGLPYISLQVRIVNEEGAPVKAGEVGEMWLKGPSIASGYWNKPDMSEQAFVDGWFKTGDIARMDADGFYYIVDRMKDMFISGGENVYPAEVEAAISHLASVAEVAVVGVADPTWGEKGVAFIVCVPGYSITESEVRSHCEARMAKFKVPKDIVLVTEIPRTGTGKAIKASLVERAKRL